MNDMAERIGLYAVSHVSAQIPGLIFREQRGGDTGLNAHLELTEDFPRMGKMIGLQVRSDENGPLERTARGYVCRGEMMHMAYWLQHSLPVLVMIYEQKSGRILWEFASADNIEVDGANWELIVPHDHVYGPACGGDIAELPCYSPYLARLALDKPWMELIEAGRRVVVEMDEWVNQPSVRGSLKLSVLSAGGAQESVYDWAFQTNANMPHVFRLPSLFPWASIAIDGEFYRNREQNTPLLPSSIRPWTVEAGEIARFQLVLSLNDLGRSFLTTERFLRRGEFPETAVWSKIGDDYEGGIKYKLYRETRNEK